MLTLVAMLLLAVAEPPAAVAPRPDDCAVAGRCRAVGKVVVRPKGQAPMTFNINRTLPWTPEGNLMLFAGETAVVRLEAAGEDGRMVPVIVLGGPQARTHALQPGEIRFDLQERNGEMFLTIQSSHEQRLRYSLVMVTTDGKPSRTSVCTLMPGIAAIEHWPHPIVQIAATNFYAQAEEGVVCK